MLEDRGRNDNIFQLIGSDFIRLSQLKFSSNVIEKVRKLVKVSVPAEQDERVKG